MTHFQLPTLLLISDHAPIRFWIKKQLDNQCFIIVAQKKEKALGIAIHTLLDLVILDSDLEEPLELCKQIRKTNPTLPIFLITGRLKKSYREAAIEAGVTDFLSEQLNVEELQMKINTAFKSAEVRKKIEQLSLKGENIDISSTQKKYTPQNESENLWQRAKKKQTELAIFDLGHMPIFNQLQIEEALLRSSNLNACLINRGSPPAIVMGISGKAEELLDLEKVKRDKIPIIRRFSGGGTVIVDENTLFFTFIFSKNDVLHIHAFPEPILRWSGALYADSFQIPNFHLVENDYAIGKKKCGGNAQYIKKDRWLHHTSFLWDYRDENMDYLLMPAKRPKYRENRPHADFLCRMKDYAPSKESLIQKLKIELQKHFTLIDRRVSDLSLPEHRQSVTWING